MIGYGFCATCERYLPGEKPSCAAFPAGIPPEIVLGGKDHRVPIDGDNGLQYVPEEGTDVERVVKIIELYGGALLTTQGPVPE